MIGVLIITWLVGIIVSSVFFKTSRVSHPFVGALAWPLIVAVLLLLAAASNRNSPVRRATRGLARRSRRGERPPRLPAGMSVQRPKYGMIDSTDE